MKSRNGSAWTYEKAGVPHLKGDPTYNRQLTKLLSRSRIPGVMGRAGGFSSLFDLGKIRTRDPILVSTTDGVGTKLEIAKLIGKHDTVGIDLVAMCVNDLITTGARPLFFLDYFATGKFKPAVVKEVLKGIIRGCQESGCALVGGETAIMPGFYGDSKYDLAGFAVGVVERRRVIDGSRVKAGNRLIGLASSGLHSNGFSLVRKLFSSRELKGALGRRFLEPTKIYVKPVLEVLKKIPVCAVANITGGSFYDNLPRVLPEGLGAWVDSSSWPRPEIFDGIQARGNISNFEMFRTFNMGIGMVLILDSKFVKLAQKILSRFKISTWNIGEVVKGKEVVIQ
ncbi:MAG: phosphoribosylformylglycinamidine cyclo-ligase [Candidatus Omnitrophica bacterium]|nr:phosphoribosylformylglycinamidine cyclo-ligase [Candidatus Omnitrophota bacterium]